MSNDTTSRRTDAEAPFDVALGAAEGIAQLLHALNHHASGSDLALLLARTSSQLQQGAVSIVREADGLSLNGQRLEVGMLAALYRGMTEHDLRLVQVSPETPPRALLQFVALLASPQGKQGVAFDQLWAEHGVWHVRVEFSSAAAEGLDESYDEPSPNALRAAALAVGRGALAGPEDPAGRLLRRSPDAAAIVLFGVLSEARASVERRRYFDAIVALRADSAFLFSALSHPAWYVVRNAAALLGAMGVESADQPLLRCIVHADSRVRVAATRALGVLETATAIEGVRLAVTDRSPEVRRVAWRALRRSSRAPQESCPLLADALLQERDVDVLRELVIIVQRMPHCATTQSIQRAAARLTDRGDVPGLACDLAEALAHRAPRLALPVLRRLADSGDEEIRRRAKAIEASHAISLS
jgi:hypothetical protein